MEDPPIRLRSVFWLPGLWLLGFCLGCAFPGPEQVFWSLGSVAGTWVWLLGPDLPLRVPIACLFGCLILAALGLALDWLRAPRPTLVGSAIAGAALAALAAAVRVDPDGIPEPHDLLPDLAIYLFQLAITGAAVGGFVLSALWRYGCMLRDDLQ